MTVEFTNEPQDALARRVVERLRTDMADEDNHPAHVATNSDGTCSDLSCPCQEFARKEVEQPRPQLWADAATVRAAIVDVLDEGRPCTIVIGCKTGHQWLFDTHDESDSETQRRVAFADAVLARVAQLQQPPHNYPRLEVLCDSHKRRRLPTYSGECADCAKERER